MFSHNLADLAADLGKIATSTRPRMRGVVVQGLRVGKSLARQYARDGAGPHGKDYYKRITSEMTGLLEGEYGPSGVPKSEFVGVGFRHGFNTDLPRSADVVGPAFIRSVDDEVGDMFREAEFR